MKNGEQVKIPYLPGMIFEDPDRENFRKNQNFVIQANTMIEKKDLVNVNLKNSLLKNYHQNLKTMTPKESRVNGEEKENPIDEYTKSVLGMKVLRFYAYFKQEMV